MAHEILHEKIMKKLPSTVDIISIQYEFAISELPLASFSKRVLVLILSYEN